MIKDNLQNYELYTNLSKNLQLGLKYLSENDFANMENGKYVINGEDVFAIVQDYQSKMLADGRFEAHEKYIDIQYVIKGEEKIGIGNVKDFTVAEKYNPEKDIVFFAEKNDDFVTMKEKDFAIFYPQDAHMPSICTDIPKYVKKVVIKVKK